MLSELFEPGNWIISSEFFNKIEENLFLIKINYCFLHAYIGNNHIFLLQEIIPPDTTYSSKPKHKH